MKRSRNPARIPTRKASHAGSPIALVTDFGTADHYVGAVKGVILSVNPSASIVDITHDIRPQQIRQAGYMLWAAYRFFPAGTVFLAVVDPGVGTPRRILAVRTAKYIFLAPDNMLLDFVLSEEPAIEAVAVETENSPYILSSVSQTFHGRDIFAPIAAYISSGISLKEVGKAVVLHPVMSPFVEKGRTTSQTAEVLDADRFGNLITNIRDLNASLARLVINKTAVDRWTRNYAEAPNRVPCLITGSSGLVEIVVKNGSAEQLLGASIGQKISVTWK